MKFAHEIVWEIACSIDEAENCTKVTGFEGKLRPDWPQKARFGRKIGGGLLGFAPGLPFRGKITARMEKKASSGRKMGGQALGL